MTPTDIHARFIDLCDNEPHLLPFDIGELADPVIAPVMLAGLVLLDGNAGNGSDDALLAAAGRALADIDAGLRTLDSWERAIASVLEALEAERAAALANVKL
jgi:hypothetical protein